MNLSIHYYVLSLSNSTSRLYEGFRDELIDIQNTEFPIYSLNSGKPKYALKTSELQLRDFLDKTDTHFAQYFKQDPLRLMLVGESRYLEIFKSLTTHSDVLIGSSEGDYSATSPHDLGKIVWPVVKLAIAGANEEALRELADAEDRDEVISGIKAVWDSTDMHSGSKLFVEDDYHINADGPQGNNGNRFMTSDGIWDIFNDVVDIIIEKVLIAGGAVIFMDSGSLMKLQRIALILRT